MVNTIRISRFKHRSEAAFFMYYVTQAGQPIGIARLGNPEFKIAPNVIFLSHMLTGTCPMALLVKFRIVFETVLHGSKNNALRNNLTVSLGNYLSVNGSWFMVR